MAGFVSRLVACLVAVVAVLQLVHLVLLNKLESTRLHELRRLQEQQQYQHFQYHQPQQQMNRNSFQDAGPDKSDHINQNLYHSSSNLRNYGSNNKNQMHGDDSFLHWGNWRRERSAVPGGPTFSELPEQEIRFDNLLREDQGAIVDSTGEFRIVFDVAGPHGSQLGSLQESPSVIDKDAAFSGTNAQADDFSIDDENFEGVAPPMDVTLVTYGDYQDIVQFLIPLVSQWNGPISVAVFASNTVEMQSVLEFISQARSCHGQARQYISFHLIFPLVETHSTHTRGGESNKRNSSNSSSRYEKLKSKQNKLQNQKRLNASMSINPNGKLSTDMIGKSCQSLRDRINKYYKSGGVVSESIRKYGGSDRHSLPTNLLRNIAKRRVGTEYSFVINMDMLPSGNLRASFQQFARDRLANSGDGKKTVFVVPAYEIKFEEQTPQQKLELLNLVDKHKARPFQFDMCWKCQMYTDYETWQKDRNPKGGKLGALFEVLWKDPWQPFFISDNSVPLFDERFRYNGVSRMSQLCELHVAGYKFAVLNDAFLVHRGYTIASIKSQDDKTSNVDITRAQFRQFKTELKDKYPHSTRRCY